MHDLMSSADGLEIACQFNPMHLFQVQKYGHGGIISLRRSGLPNTLAAIQMPCHSIVPHEHIQCDLTPHLRISKADAMR